VESANALHSRIEKRLSTALECVKQRDESAMWRSSDIVLITYANSFSSHDTTPLETLKNLLLDWFPGLFKQVHLLPFYPYTSDDGFSVSDYRRVDAVHGDWSDIESLSDEVELVFDYVINHGSSAHARFQEFLEDRPPGNRFFKTAPAESDVSRVTRPRAAPLLQAYDTAKGTQHVWCTFSRDQVDWDFSNPDVLYEFIDVFIMYIERGATWLRIDAIAYLWKELGTSCVHLPQTHTVVKLLRAIAEKISPAIKLLTETNVPLAENLSYFGQGDEAHIVYNFSLPPLLTHALLTGDGNTLSTWCQQLPQLESGCTFLNFTASHDGIGLRPAEGILDDTQLSELVECIETFGGRLTHRTQADGSLSPYEANISLFDAFKGTVAGEDEWQVERFLSSQCVMMTLTGVPAVYYNSLFGAPNDQEGVKRTGRNRTINRRKWTLEELESRLKAPNSASKRVFDGMKSLIAARQSQPAFHPEGSQECMMLHPALFVLLRTAPTGRQALLCLSNLRHSEVSVSWASVPLESCGVRAVFTQGDVFLGSDTITFSPYAALWLDITP